MKVDSRSLAMLLIILGLSASVPTAKAGNPLLRRLTTDGLAIGDRTHRFESPTIGEQFGPDQQRRVVEEVAGRHGWQRFSRDSVVAPFTLKIDSIKSGTDARVGHVVDLWFVAYGKLDVFASDVDVRKLIDPDLKQHAGDARAEPVGEQQLSANGIRMATESEFRESYVLGEFPLMNQVYVRGVGRTVVSHTERSVVVAWELDERFAGDAQLAAQWQPITTDDLGRKQRGPPRSYSGYGGYAKITQLTAPAGALFVECHFAFHEPVVWFKGSNLVRSKLPLLVQESVRKFRRRLK